MIQKINVLLVLILISQPLRADFFDPSPTKTPKWTRFSIAYGRSNSSLTEQESYSFNAFTLRNMRGKFSYGAEYSFIYQGGKKVDSSLVNFGIRPDWNMEVEPSLEVSFGLSNANGLDLNPGTSSHVSLNLDCIRGSFYSTTIQLRKSFYQLSGEGKTHFEVQTVSFSLNFDFY